VSHYHPYPNYKDSGIDWLGQVPEHWQIAQLKRLLSIQNGSDHKAIEAETGIPVYGSGGVFAYANDYIYDGESVLLGRKGTIDKPLYVNERFWTVDTMYWSKIMPNADGRFCYYVATTIPFSRYSTNTALPSMTQTDLGSHLVAFPEKNEQKSISSFLDKETARIESLIAKKTRFIELLKEKRQALITHAVTKGLNPDAPMKDSGIEWIDEVPEHWLKRKVFHAFGIIGSGTTPPSKEPEWYEGGTIPWITTSELRENEIFETKKCVTLETLDKFSTLKIYPADSLAIAMYGATIGRLGFLGLPATTNQACCVLSGERDLNLRFVYYWLIAFKDTVIEYFSEGGGQPNINQDVVANLWIPSPSLKEQQSIVESISYESERIDLLISKTQNSIELLKERRSAFIAAAVTGQIDLREVS
jgi:type I restriction enzyme S subunit